jgi:2-C-methyl-D-erythritol 4-phosphate cytidylyltransferase
MHPQPCAIVPLPQTMDPAAAFVPVAGESPLVRVVRSVLGSVAASRVVVAAAPALAEEARERLRAAGVAGVEVTVAADPGSRSQALRAGLECLGVEPHSSTPVLICDHRYPLSPKGLADGVLAALGDGHDVVMPALSVTDTVKTVDDVGSVLGTLDRSVLRTVQYPRGFTASSLWSLLESTVTTSADDFEELGVALRAGLEIHAVDGDANAFAVELPRDTELLEAIIACRPD